MLRPSLSPVDLSDCSQQGWPGDAVLSASSVAWELSPGPHLGALT